MKEDGKIKWSTRFAYGCGDTACNVVFGMISTLLTLFYTDYVGINPATIGLIMLISRMFDGVSDAIMGLLVERTKSKWGKSRPWILWMSLPFAVAAVLLFAVPHSTAMVQAVYIFVTYNLINTVCYTAINLPYSSLSAMMTRISSERDMLSVVRMGLSPFGRILAVTCTMPVVKLFGNNQSAWIKTMTIWASIAFILLLICFFKCEEKVVIEAQAKQEKIPLKQSLKALVTNQYFWAVVIIVVATFLSPMLLKKYGKRNMSLAGACLALVGQLIFCLNPTNFGFMVFSCVIRGLGLAPLNSIVFGFLGDVVEFGQWKNHIRQESLIFAGSSVGMKVGAGLTSAIITGLLSISGYISSTSGAIEQPDSAIRMIINVYRFAPLVVWVSVIITLSLYKLDKMYPMIMKELTEREAKGVL